MSLMLAFSLKQFLLKLLDPWVIVGFTGQFIFFLRFAIQWYTSERRRRTVVPESFWYFSVVGGLITLVYAIRIQDPVFMMAQTLGLVIYIRNIVLIRRRHGVLSRLRALRAERVG